MNLPEPPRAGVPVRTDTVEADKDIAEPSFGEILQQFEQSHSGEKSLEGTVVSVSPEFVYVDIGRKMDGALPREGPAADLKPGEKVLVSIAGRDEEGVYRLSTVKVERPKDWSGLEAAFAEKRTIAATVTEVVKGGLRVDVGVRAFMPASRTGTRDQAELEKLVGQEIECRITKLDTASEDVVVDRRVVLEEAERRAKQEAFEKLEEGVVVPGTVRSVTDFGAFVDIGGFDGLLHVADMAWNRVAKPGDLVKPGDTFDVKVLKINRETRKISLGLKQLVPDPWSQVAEKYVPQQKVTGTVARVTEFGAFIELEPGVEGLVHVSEMAWGRKVKKASDVVNAGDRVEVVVLNVNAADRRIGLGLKQALGDPWEDAEKKLAIGSAVEGKISNLAKFGAFVDLGNGIEGMIHIGDISREKRLNHPNEVLKEGQTVRAQVLELDRARRRVRLGMKQLEPTSIDEYIAEHRAGESVSGRVVEVAGNDAKVELGEGVIARCKLPKEPAAETSSTAQTADLSSMTAMLTAKWKEGAGPQSAKSEAVRTGQVRSFRIAALDPAKKAIEVELAG